MSRAVRANSLHARAALGLVAAAAGLATAFPGGAASEPASQPLAPPAAGLDAGADHTCAVGTGGGVHCWGFGAAGQLGYASVSTIGDDEVPGFAGALSLGVGRAAVGVGAGLAHTCAVLDDRSLRCWGFGSDGRLGYAATRTIGDDEAPASAGPVDLGPGRSAAAVTAGDHHTCALLDGGGVRCWGSNLYGQLGYANSTVIGDDETPASVGVVDLGVGRHAKAVTAGARHTCALLDDGSVRCWGSSGNGQLGYGTTAPVGDDETPGSVAPVDLGPGRRATAISAGDLHTCAVLDNGSVRCWGFNFNGELGYGNTVQVGDNETPGSVPPVALGGGRTALAISAGSRHSCALLENGTVRCWGEGAQGRLGYAGTATIGDDETPGSRTPVNLESGRLATAVSAGGAHTCARLDDGGVRCWGSGGNGRLGLCGARNIGDDEPPGSADRVMLTVPAAGSGCPVAAAPPARGAVPALPDGEVEGQRAQAARLRRLRSCFTTATRHVRREIAGARSLSDSKRARARRHARRHRSRLRRRCLARHGRTPARVARLRARAVRARTIELSFDAPASDGRRPPAARTYLVKQSSRPIRSARAFRRARALCRGSCRFSAVRVGGRLTLTVTDLRPGATYHYAVAARDNVSGRPGPRSLPGSVRAR